MAPTPSTVRLPNGTILTVVPVFGGFFFKPHELNVHHNAFPAGWTVIIQTEVFNEEPAQGAELVGMPKEKEGRRHVIHPYKLPTLNNDIMFISSLSRPSSHEFKEPQSPTRQIAMMLWASLYWYFHQREPLPYLSTAASKNTPEAGKPKGEWRISIKREGILQGRNLIQKLERMGLVMSEDSSVGENTEENTSEGWSDMFTSKRAFWQSPAKLFLFTLIPATNSPATPYGSRPSSPVRGASSSTPNTRENVPLGSPGLWSPSIAGPFSSGSHLPTYYPPAPLQYKMTDGIRHPIRPKPPRQGETFYTRFVPSQGQYLSFRVASLSPKPVLYTGPTSALGTPAGHLKTSSLSSLPAHISAANASDHALPSPTSTTDTLLMSDVQLLNKWMNDPRVSKFWGCAGTQDVQDTFLRTNMKAKNSFPVIGMWDGKPFGYFEVYWVKEDILGKYLGDRADDFDRGVHVLVGEQEFRGPDRLKSWITSLAHWAFIQDYRTKAVVLEPRVDNERFISTLGQAGYLREGEITFPHKQSAFVKLKRENFEAPFL